MKAVFMTGTDTDAGKTFVSCQLLRELNHLGYKTVGIKPIASGCQYNNDQQLRSEDALALQQAASMSLPYDVVNPIAFHEPIAPHLAAEKIHFALTKQLAKNCIIASLQKDADVHVIEGAGGWSVPLNDHELVSHTIAELAMPVILVVGVRLGCINHSLLTYANIKALNVPFIGWIANCLQPATLMIEENIATLRQWISEPCLGVVPYLCDGVGHIDAKQIMRFISRSASVLGDGGLDNQ